MKKKDPTSHRIIEKRRRDRMNNCLADLSKLIPAHYMKKGRGRVEKTEIIEMAIKHLKDLIESNNARSSQKLYQVDQNKTSSSSSSSINDDNNSKKSSSNNNVGHQQTSSSSSSSNCSSIHLSFNLNNSDALEKPTDQLMSLSSFSSQKTANNNNTHQDVAKFIKLAQRVEEDDDDDKVQFRSSPTSSSNSSSDSSSSSSSSSSSGSSSSGSSLHSSSGSLSRDESVHRENSLLICSCGATILLNDAEQTAQTSDSSSSYTSTSNQERLNGSYPHNHHHNHHIHQHQQHLQYPQQQQQQQQPQKSAWYKKAWLVRSFSCSPTQR